MKKQWDLKPRKLVQLVNFKKPYQIVSSQAVSFSQGWTHLKIGRMNMTNLDFCLDLQLHILHRDAFGSSKTSVFPICCAYIFCMVAELLVDLVAWVIGFLDTLGLTTLVVVAVSTASVGTVTLVRHRREVARKERIKGKWLRLVRKIKTIRKRQRQFAYVGHFLNSLDHTFTRRLRAIFEKQ